jgi:hypothetical protein
MKQLLLTVFLGLMSVCAFAGSTNVTIQMQSATAVRQTMVVGDVHTNFVSFACDVVLDNQTGAMLSVTGLYSPFDDMSLVAFDSKGNEVARRRHYEGMANAQNQTFVVPVGQSTEKLIFTWVSVPKSMQTVKIRIQGTLPDSSYKGSIASNVVEVEIKK